jgi:fumarylacetoacetate (FAA) hydrolase family protein
MPDYHKSPAKQDLPYGVMFFCGTIAVPELDSQGHSLVMTQKKYLCYCF